MYSFINLTPLIYTSLRIILLLLSHSFSYHCYSFQISPALALALAPTSHYSTLFRTRPFQLQRPTLFRNNILAQEEKKKNTILYQIPSPSNHLSTPMITTTACIGNQLDNNHGMNTLHERLQACNVTNYCFINDHNFTDQYVPVEVECNACDCNVNDYDGNINGNDNGNGNGNGDINDTGTPTKKIIQLQHSSSIQEQKYLNAVHVKTLVWKGVYLKSNSNTPQNDNDIEDNSNNHNNTSSSTSESNGANAGKTDDSDKNNDKQCRKHQHQHQQQELNKPFYFVTALRVQDKVDVKSLRALVKREWPRKKKVQTPKNRNNDEIDGSCSNNSNNNNNNNDSGGMLILQLAEQRIAEELTGFKSGSMPPGWHTVPMTLFIDEYIIQHASLTIPSLSPTSTSTSISSSAVNGNSGHDGSHTNGFDNDESADKHGNDNKADNIKRNIANGSTRSASSEAAAAAAASPNQRQNSFSQIYVSVGSGAEDYSLHVSLQDVFNSSTYHNKTYFGECSYSGIPSTNNERNDSDNQDETSTSKVSAEYSDLLHEMKNDGHSARKICSFSRASVEFASKQKRQQQEQRQHDRNIQMAQHNGQNGEQISAESTQALTTKIASNAVLRTKLNRKAFNVAARKKGKTELVKQMIEVMGDELFLTYMQVDQPNEKQRFGGEFNKNALHYAAWKGDLETISLLINTAKQYEDVIGDAVNIISTGEGNFGKTAIFYSITQCRDDAVILLLSLGASLLIVNNKGQTPCSLAVNKLKKETCEFMFQMEAHQLKAGETFADYRKTHSDGQRYGDLDPRFIRPGDVNVDEDLLEEIGISSNLADADVLDIDFEALSLPRSVRVTTLLMRQQKWMKENGQEPLINGDAKASVVEATDYVEPTKSSNEETKQTKHASKDELSNLVKENRKQYKTSNTLVKLLDGNELDILSLPSLHLDEVLSSSSNGTQRTFELIDDEAGLLTFQFAVDEAISILDKDDDYESDISIIDSSWGLDCEWRPTHVSGEESPIAILQISSGSRAFVIDTQTLLQPGIKNDSIDLTPSEIALSESLTKLFSNPKIRILGFGIGQDLTKLAASFPHVPCFREFNAVIDLQGLSRHVYPGTPKQYMSSLQKTVAILLRKRLNKTEQCSEWDARPLSASQLEYASLDATILPKLLKMMMDNNQTVEKQNGFFMRKHSYLQTSYRFTFLADNGDTAYRVAMGSIKHSMKMKFARQTWPTFKQKPALPEFIPLHEQALHASLRQTKKKEKKINPQTTEKRTKKNAISVSMLTALLQNLPKSGITLGYTKESVIERVVGKQVIGSLPDNAYLQYNRRGGIIELGNAFLLFVNFGVGRVHHKYRNEFLSKGRQVTFTINQSRYEDGELLQTLLTPHDEAMYFQKPVLFFIRASTRDKFMFCGKVKYFEHEEKEGDLIDVVLDLTNYDDLVAHSMNSDGEITYMSIVASQGNNQ